MASQGHSLDELMMLKSCSHPQSFRWIVKMIDLNKRLGLVHLLPGELKSKADMFPPAAPESLQEALKKMGPVASRGPKVGYYPGCLTNSLYPHIGIDVVRVLQHHGYNVVIPHDTVCCGLPHKAAGEHAEHRRQARENIDFFLTQEVDYIVTNCATCTYALREYGHLFESDTELGARATTFSSKCHDIMEFLTDVSGLKVGPRSLGDITVTYHDSCHLHRRLKVTKQPRKLLDALPGATFTEMPKANWCCGAAGSYGFKHPAIARKILEQKMGNCRSVEAQVITAGCLGCLMQLDYGRREFGLDCSVKHPIELLARTY
jgi:glycolate oxidase iron-sulfur subunit